MNRILLVMGTRPEAIKMAPLVYALRTGLPQTEVQVCVTAQHRQMLDQVLNLFKIIPNIDLDLMKAGQGLEELSARMLTGLREVIELQKPSLILVHGDTTTTLMAALAGFYARVPVGHIEAGLRTHDLTSPFPEEMNRQVVSKLASWHFAPTESACQNLLAERVPKDRIFVTGNTVIDALHWVLDRSNKDLQLAKEITAQLADLVPFDWKKNDFVLITGHRRENFGDGIEQVCLALHTLASRHPDFRFVFPVHRNPNVLGPVTRLLGNLPNIHLIEPLDYLLFVNLLQHATIVLTDSGGIQEEAPSLGKPVLVMREVTERPEAVAAGTVKLVGTDCAKIVAMTSLLLSKGQDFQTMTKASNPYGDGEACRRIVQTLQSQGWK